MFNFIKKKNKEILNTVSEKMEEVKESTIVGLKECYGFEYTIKTPAEILKQSRA